MHRVDCLFTAAVLTIRWGRVTLLEALSKYRATDVKDAEHVCERVVPQFQHQNASVVMAAVKVVMLNLNNVSPDMQRSLIKKMGPPLGTFTFPSSTNDSHYDFLRSRSPIRSSPKHLSYLTKTTRHPLQRMENLCTSPPIPRANDSAAASTIQITSNT